MTMNPWNPLSRGRTAARWKLLTTTTAAVAATATGAFARQTTGAPSAAPAQVRPAGAPQPQDQEGRISELERKNTELERRLDVLAGEVERTELGDVVGPLEESVSGLGPAASKVYGAQEGISIGGYGEAIFKDFQGGDDEIDALRTVLYFGYEFDERWLFNSEIEFEHASTGEDGEVSVEFAYLDGRFRDAANLRAGLLLVPMGITNERHEPTTFPSANRPFVERFVLPTTWRELGAGVWGDAEDFSYRTYVIDGFDATGFSASGLRGGRQQGSEALAEDFAWVGRLDWHGVEGLVLGASAYVGDSGQSQIGADVSTTIWEAHAEYRWQALTVRGLAAQAELDDVDELNAALGLAGSASVGETIRGAYVEVAYDVLAASDAGSRASLEPFVRYEAFDTQADVPSGFSSDPANDVEVTTFGVAYRPNDNVVFKLDFNDFDNDAGTAVDQIDVAMGFTF